eukprot:1136394-Pelagomonas_calceolata.AAC.7
MACPKVFIHPSLRDKQRPTAGKQKARSKEQSPEHRTCGSGPLGAVEGEVQSSICMEGGLKGCRVWKGRPAMESIGAEMPESCAQKKMERDY